MNHTNAFLRSLHVTAEIMGFMAEAKLDDNERYLFNHVIDRFGEKRGFKVTWDAGNIDMKGQIDTMLTKLIGIGLVERVSETPDYNWTEKWKAIRYGEV